MNIDIWNINIQLKELKTESFAKSYKITLQSAVGVR